MMGSVAQLQHTTTPRRGFDRRGRFGSSLATALAAGLVGFWTSTGWAAETGETPATSAETSSEILGLTVDARLGAALLLRSQSHAPAHLFKPDLRLGGRVNWGERWEFGAAVSALLAGSEHYRVLGLLGSARFAPLQFGAFSLGVSAALGAGYDADILHTSLEADGSIAPYYFAALDGRWRIGHWLVGVEGAFQNLAMLQAGVVVGWSSATVTSP